MLSGALALTGKPTPAPAKEVAPSGLDVSVLDEHDKKQLVELQLDDKVRDTLRAHSRSEPLRASLV